MAYVNIEDINQAYNIRLDPHILTEFVVIPDGAPEWKKEIFRRKNNKILEDAIREAVAKKDPYAGEPDWKKGLLKKRDETKAEMEKRLAEEQRIREENVRRFNANPIWKQELLYRRSSLQNDNKV